MRSRRGSGPRIASPRTGWMEHRSSIHEGSSQAVRESARAASGSRRCRRPAPPSIPKAARRRPHRSTLRVRIRERSSRRLSGLPHDPATAASSTRETGTPRQIALRRARQSSRRTEGRLCSTPRPDRARTSGTRRGRYQSSQQIVRRNSFTGERTGRSCTSLPDRDYSNHASELTSPLTILVTGFMVPVKTSLARAGALLG